MGFKNIFLTSFLLTVLIFTAGLLINYGLDFLRIDTILDVMAEHELDTESYLIQKDFSESFGGTNCELLTSRVAYLKEEIRDVGEDLGSYGRISFFKKKDFDYLKRKYFLLESRFLLNIKQINEECGDPYIPVIFFYEIDHSLSERQGVILSDVSKKNDKVIVLAIDKDYEDEPLVKLLATRYDISDAPAIVINEIKREGLLYEGDINAILRDEFLKADPNAEQYDFDYVINAAGFDKEEMILSFKKSLEKDTPNPVKGDLLLVLGRLTDNKSLICNSISYYKDAETSSIEEEAIIYETIASLDCSEEKSEYLKKASEFWKKLGNDFRSEIDEKLALNQELTLNFETSNINSQLSVPDIFEKIKIGTTSVTLDKSSLILSQVDRVYRDWLGHQLEQSPFQGNLLVTFSERLSLDEPELLPAIGWHEGGRIKEMKKAGLKQITAVGTLVAKKNRKWYAIDDKGVFRFEVPLDKVLYPTTRFLREDLAVIIDTHGVNMLVEQSIRNEVDAVVSDCDHPGKVKAAKYLSENGIKVICFPDKFLYLALGHNLDVVGSPPLSLNDKKVVVGNQVVILDRKEKIVVMNATVEKYALWYYQTPTHYFEELEKYMDLNVEYITINDFNQMEEFIRLAKSSNAHVVAVRVYNSDDYINLKNWLDDDINNRAILFHSASYPHGYKILKEYPKQTTFGDVNIKFN